LFEATTGQPTVIGQATTDAFGHFSISSPNNMSPSIFYVSADVGEHVEFLTVLGTRLPATVIINELTTVAASYSMAQFYKTDVISGNSFSLQIAAGMNDNLVTPCDRWIVVCAVEFTQCRRNEFTAFHAITSQPVSCMRARRLCHFHLS